MRLRNKLLLPLIISFIFLLFGLTYSVSKELDSSLYKQTYNSLVSLSKTKVFLTKEDISRDVSDPVLQERFVAFNQIDPSIFRIKVWNEDMRIIFSDLNQPIGSNDDAHADLVKTAFTDPRIIWQRVTTPANDTSTEGQFGQYLVGIIPIQDNLGKTIFVVELYSSLSYFQSTLNNARFTIITILVLFILLLSVVEYIILNISVLKPIKVIYGGISSLGTDSFKDIAIKSGDEFGILAQKFNEAQRKIMEGGAQLESNAIELNKSTELLKAKVAELEHLNKFMINRELKMIELKKEIQGLKNKLGEA